MTEESAAPHELIDAFERRYEYDAAYLHDLYDRSPEAYAVFSAAQPMTSFREQLLADAHYVAAITVMRLEDCGPCLQLNIKLAMESGVDREVLRTLLETPEDLPQQLRDIRQHTETVIRGDVPDEECARRIISHYGAAAFGELAICIAGVRIYPTLKRALLKAGHCAVTGAGLE